MQVSQATHVVGEILETYPRPRPYKPDTANQRPAHVVRLRPEDMLYTCPKPRTTLVARLRLCWLFRDSKPSGRDVLLEMPNIWRWWVQVKGRRRGWGLPPCKRPGPCRGEGHHHANRHSCSVAMTRRVHSRQLFSSASYFSRCPVQRLARAFSFPPATANRVGRQAEIQRRRH